MATLTRIFLFLIFMLLLNLFFIYWGYNNNINEFLLFGLGIPVWGYLLLGYIKLVNKINVGEQQFTIHNVLFGKKIIPFKDIKTWKYSNTIRINQKTLFITTNKEKITLSSLSDLHNFEKLRHKLRTHQNKYQQKNTLS